MFADLHLHTHFSDGTWSPAELARAAAAAGFSAVALTDHDTVEGSDAMEAACREAGVRYITGTELTAEQDGHEIHILAYFIDTQHPRLLIEMARFQGVRQDRIREMVSRLNRLDVPLEADAVFALAGCRSPGRPHVARALVQAGFCPDQDDAFERFLKKNRPAWVPKFKMSAREAIDLVHEAGGLAIMAHPGLNRCDQVIPGMVRSGLDGLECFHSRHSPAVSNHYIHLATKHRILITGGSDCHGFAKGKPLLGTVRLPWEYLERLEQKAAQKKAARPS